MVVTSPGSGVSVTAFSSPNWSNEILRYTYLGSAELVWLLTLPLLAEFLGDRRRRAYLVTFPVVLVLTFANPLFFDLVATRLTSYHTYYRLLWLFPVGAGLGALLAFRDRGQGGGNA